ncbi:BamA/TamA family outer membrane protein [Solitalea koreensis]|uniref:Surface antigen n=1 Tax=Solitalea koreensis TaxID=543615 RepID=A0A521AX05_9SPHI|nr:BamA/TamA family outer membrane protein [Solitalea koreensis]SMO39314.1 Surface antigen [Solitalea koreensis]
MPNNIYLHGMQFNFLKKRTLLICICLTNWITITFAQQNTKTDTAAVKKENSLLPIPVIGSSQEKGFEFGAAAVYSFYLNKKNSIVQRNSTLGLITTYTTMNQSKVSLNGNFWTAANTWHIIGDIKYYNFPNNFYGIGNNTLYADQDLINDKKSRFNVDVEREVAKNFYAGVGLWFLNEKISEKDSTGIYDSSELEGKSGGKTNYLAFSATLDDRDIVNYPYKGNYLRAYLQNSFNAIGSDFNFVLITLDARKYFKVHPTTVIAVQGYAQSLQGGDKPFFLLPQMGSDLLMRGYYTGRYRDQNYLAFQSEVRLRPFANREDKGWFSLSRGVFAAFAGGGSVFKNGDFKFNNFKPNYGIGGRYIFDPRNRLTLRVDYGFGSKNEGEPRNSGFYLSLNEAF